MRALEAEILAELREVTGLTKLRQRDITEWSTGKVSAREPEIVVRLPRLQVNVAYVPRV